MSKRGVRWVLSNRDTPTVRDLFSFAKITRLTTRRSVAAQNRRDVQPTDSPEVIIAGEKYR
jgi:DNA adenine methylase